MGKFAFLERLLKVKNCLWILLLLNGCANWQLKEKCEKTNWFEHAQQVAFEGRYLEEDGFVKACKGLDLISYEQIDLGFKLGRDKMCNYDEIFSRGKSGTPVFFKFCDGLNPQKMKDQFTAGLKIFCTKESGYPYGKSGKTYQNVCSADQEKDFLPAYYKGRKEYLRDRIHSLGKELDELRADAKLLASREGRVSIEYSSLTNILRCTTKLIYDEFAKTNVNRWVCEEPLHVINQRNILMNQLTDIRKHLQTAMSQIQKAQDERAWAQQELTKIPM